ncbi:MAG: FAD-dependent oxidoreductase, partial [Rhodanobacteraceae bacterium]
MQKSSDIPTTFADDPHERERGHNVRPDEWRNPQPAPCYDLVVIGAGTAGLSAARAAAALGAKVALIERNLLGGTCLNVGCVPSKAIIRTSRLYAEMRDAEQYGGCAPTDIRVDFSAVMRRVRG